MPKAFWKTDIMNEKELYVLPCILSPGKHSYVIRHGLDKAGEPIYHHHSTLSDIRPEEIPSFIKIANKNHIKRVFDKECSVFAEWKEDKARDYSNMLRYDGDYWKLGKFIKD
jgi:hypothetical protein